MDSLFETVTITLNGSNINKNVGKYPYRSYISKLLSYPESTKMSWMQSEGWYEDATGHFSGDHISTDLGGFKDRRALFTKRKDNEADPNEFDTQFVPMFGRIYSDLNTMSCGIMPGIRMNINMEFSKDKFRILSKSVKDVKIEISKISLHVPLGAVNPNIYKSIQERMAKEPCRVFYKRFEMAHFTINSGVQSFTQIINTSTGSGASRMIVAFLTLQQFEGKLTHNPYEFARRWVITTTSDSTPPVVTTKTNWVRRVELSLNGKPLDCLNADATEHDDQVSFLRMNQILGHIGNPTSNGIGYRKWVNNSALFVFDLTVTGRSGQMGDVLTPMVKTGDTRLDVTFGGDPTVTEMKVLVFSEYPSLYSIKDDGKEMNFSYISALVQ